MQKILTMIILKKTSNGQNNLIILFVFLFSVALFGQKTETQTSQNNAIIADFMKLSLQQLYDTANYYHDKSIYDTALICFNLVINNYPLRDDIELINILINTNTKMGHIYSTMSEYINAYKHYIEALKLCEKYDIKSEQQLIYNKIGVIYGQFKEYEIAKTFFLKSWSIDENNEFLDRVFNNLGVIELNKKNLDSAYYYFDKGLQITKQYNTTILPSILSNIALIYSNKKQYDSAYYYYQLSIQEARKNNNHSSEATACGNLSIMFDALNNSDSVLFYLELSKNIAYENNLLNVLSDIYELMSKYEEKRGNTNMAFYYHKKYSSIKDSLFNINTFGNINQLQRLYEVSKTNQQIEQLIIEQKIKEETIRYKNIIWYITLAILVLVAFGLTFFIVQNRKLSKAYNNLFETNMEFIELQKNTTQTVKKNYKKNNLKDDDQKVILEKILIIMEEKSIFCDPNFSIGKLAGLVDSNYSYVSQIFNKGLKKNFRTFLNEFRIKEAQKLLNEPEFAKYTIESIANKVGFKSQSAFRAAFKEILGANPNEYLKTIKEKENDII